MTRIAFIVSHPIQYYAPLHRRLAARKDLEIKVFFTWHGGESAQLDQGFQKPVAWDIPLTEGYEFAVVPNTARDPGSHHFFGLRNPTLVESVLAWKPDAVHLTGYAFASHLQALRSLRQAGLPVLFRGDSHLLDGEGSRWRWWFKRSLLRTVFRWPSAFLFVGQANRDYYRAFGVPEAKLVHCPHSIEVDRFSEPDAEWEQRAKAWRAGLGVGDETRVLLFAGKFEDKKRPVALMTAFLELARPRLMLFMVGDGEHGAAVRELASRHPERFRVLPFQNQSLMPAVYRLGDVFVLPSAYGETWGLAVNEALACGRPVLVSDRVGCHPDVVRRGVSGDTFAWQDWEDFGVKLNLLLGEDWQARRQELRTWARKWSIEQTEESLVETVRRVSKPS